MTSPAQPTWRDTLSAFAYRHLRLPQPKLETGRFGWATRWFLDWLVPTGASAWAAYHLAAAFVAHYRSVLPANVGHDVPLGVMSELMSLANSKPFAYTGISLVAVLVALMFHRYLTWPAPGRWLNRRKRPVIHALPFMLGFLAGKLLAFAVPALAVAVAAYASEGAIGAIAPLAAPIALLSAAYYFLLYDEVRPPAIVSLSFHRSRQRSAGAGATHQAREPDGAAVVGIGAWRDAHDELRDDVLAIADAAGRHVRTECIRVARHRRHRDRDCVEHRRSPSVRSAEALARRANRSRAAQVARQGLRERLAARREGDARIAGRARGSAPRRCVLAPRIRAHRPAWLGIAESAGRTRRAHRRRSDRQRAGGRVGRAAPATPDAYVRVRLAGARRSISR